MTYLQKILDSHRLKAKNDNRDFESLERESQISRNGSRQMLGISTTGVNRTRLEGGPEECCSQAFNFIVTHNYYLVTGIR